jgi:hypothetical protein
LVPTFTTPFFHWYEGVVPPFTGAAVNVTEEPAQTVFDGQDILRPAVTFGLTVIVIVFDVAGLFDTQASLDVNMQLTASPLVKAELL